MRKVRLADIAENLGVSTVTVYNALSGQKGVSEELRARIRKTADDMGYQPRASSKKQQTNDTFKKIGVLINEKYLAQYTTFYWKMYQEMAIAATEKKCFTAVEVLRHDAEDRHIPPQIVQDQSVEGLIVIGEIKKEYIRSTREKVDIPTVFLDFYDKDLAQDAVVTDNFYGMYLLTEYLFERGLTKLAYVGSIHATSSIMDRFCGFQKALYTHNVVLPDAWLIEDRDLTGQVAFDLPEQLPEAFVCNCDLVAAMTIMKLSERGLRVPEDVSVVGFDNYLYPGLADMKITTYEVDTKSMAKMALDKVLKQIRNPSSGHGMNIVNGHIVLKNSVK